jgi:hypothetical protein
MMALAESRAQTHKKHTTKFYVEISEIDWEKSRRVVYSLARQLKE